MISLFILLAWSGLGVGVAAMTAPTTEPRMAWAPMAALLGPLWGPVARERRQVADDLA